MRCQTCGEELREGARFCPTCGTPTPTPAAGGEPLTQPTIQVPRSALSGTGGVPEPPAPRQAPEPVPSRASEPGRAGRDPGADYNPVGPPRPAAQSARTTVTPGRGAATGAASAAGGAPRMAAPSSADLGRVWRGFLRLLRLDTSVFGEVYADASAMVPVAIFAAAVLVLSGLGGMLFISSLYDGFDVYDELLDRHGSAEFFFLSVLLGTLLALVMWAAWSWVTTFLLRQLAGVQADLYGIARVLGLALAPLVLALLLIFDDGFFALGMISLGAVASLAVIGVLESVDVRPGPAWLATLAGFALFVIVLSFLGHGGRDLAPGFFAAP